jgi:DNA-binding NarL/FixJ family response regulator
MRSLVIVADQPLVVEAVRLAMRQTTGLQIIGHVRGTQPVAGAIARVSPDIVLIDDMDDRELAVERIAEVARAVPRAHILLLTMGMKEDWLEQAIAAGAQGILCKGLHPLSFATLVREIVNGNVYHRYTPAERVRKEEHLGLTKRELQILRLMAGGAPNGGIARELWVTEQTVKFHLSNIYRKLGVRNRTEAAHYAHVHGLLDMTDQLALAS